MKYTIVGLVLVVLIFAVLEVPAATIVVDGGGSGDFIDIHSAVIAAIDGDTILVVPGVYPTSVTVEKSLIIAGQGNAEEVILDGQDQRIMLLQGECEVTLRNLCLQGGFGSPGAAVLSWQGTDLVVEGCVFRDNVSGSSGGAIDARLAAGFLALRDCVFEYNESGQHGGAVTVINGIDCDIEGCIFRENYGGWHSAGGLTAHEAGNIRVSGTVFDHNICGSGAAARISGCDSAVVENCTFYRNFVGTSCTALLVHDTPLVFQGSIIANTIFGYGIVVSGIGALTDEFNVFWDNANGDWLDGAIGPSDAHVDPQFCDPLSRDYSPCYQSYAVIGTEYGLIGAMEPSCPCDVVRTEGHSWSSVKQMFR